VQDSVKVRFFFGADTVTADLTMRDFFQIEDIDQFINGGVPSKIGLVTED
jgi:hypothetical protein